MKKLTKKQNDVLKFISKFIDENKYPPTRAEISNYFGWSSANAAQCFIEALVKKGRIEIVKGSMRGLRVIYA